MIAGPNLDLVSAIRVGGLERERVFEYWVQQRAEHFAKGEEGYKYYCAILEVIKEFCAAEGVREYEKRFMPLVDQQFVHDMFIDTFAEVFERGLRHSTGSPWWKKIWRVVRPW